MRFQTTRWSLVLDARQDGEPARRALSDLCRAYRGPVLSYVRRHARNDDDAQDLTQAFFAHFLEHATHARADPARGSFRAFLVTSLRHFLHDQASHRDAQRRGGGVRAQTLDATDPGELVAACEPTPEQAFERDWALAVLQAAIARLQAETRAAGKADLFAALSEFLIERPTASDYERIASAQRMRRNTVAVAVHRLRQRLHDLVRAELADTTADPSQLDHELDAVSHSLHWETTPPSR